MYLYVSFKQNNVALLKNKLQRGRKAVSGNISRQKPIFSKYDIFLAATVGPSYIFGPVFFGPIHTLTPV